MSTKPLFIPLKSEFFELYKRGEKDTEYRPHGPRWNIETCFLGRPVVLSKGYGKKDRLYGHVTHIRVDDNPTMLPGWLRCYGEKYDLAICITVRLARNCETSR